MTPTASLAATLTFLSGAAAADPLATLLSASPFTSDPFYNGSYYVTELSVDACVLTKTTASYDRDDKLEKKVAITIDLARIDPDRVEVSGNDVNLWAETGAHVTCADLVGDSCVVAERPGESIPMPGGLDLRAGREHASAVRALAESCR